MKPLSLLALGALLLAGPAYAAVGPAWTTVKVSDAWVREAPPGAVALAGYMAIANPAGEALTLAGASSPQFREVQMHEVVEENGMAHMVEVKALDVAARGELRFAPGGTHLMLIGPKQPLKARDPVTIVLQWKGGGKTTVKTAVRPREARPAGHEHGHDHADPNHKH